MPSLINRIFGSAFRYDALESSGKRRRSEPAKYREDQYTKQTRHRQLQGNAADLARNLSLASWMVRRHLDYVSQFTFHSRTDDAAIDEQIEMLMKRDAAPERFDVARKFGREKFFRLAEHRRVLDGDTLLIKMSSGHLQGVQADLIRDPNDPQTPDDTWITGVKITKSGMPQAFGLYQRTGYSGVEYVRQVRARNAIHYGFFERYAADQVRGVSPIVAALNPLRDVYENFNFALMKAKISQLFALAVYRESQQQMWDIEGDGSGSHDPDGDHVAEPRGFKAFVKSDTRYVDMNPGEKVEIIESKTPSGEFQNFTNLVIQVAIKALDIPYSFYDESHTNFFGSRAAWLHYERSCSDKRADQIQMRRNYTRWKLQQWVLSGELILPRGMTVDDIMYEWVPRGMPWWDPSKEIRGQIEAISAGLDTPQRITKQTGSDFYDNVDEIARAMEYAKERGVPLSFATAQAPTLQEAQEDNPEDEGPSDDIEEEPEDQEEEAEDDGSDSEA